MTFSFRLSLGVICLFLIRTYSRAQACSEPIRYFLFYHEQSQTEGHIFHIGKTRGLHSDQFCRAEFLQSQLNFPKFGSQADVTFLRLQKNKQKGKSMLLSCFKSTTETFKTALKDSRGPKQSGPGKVKPQIQRRYFNNLKNSHQEYIKIF